MNHRLLKLLIISVFVQACWSSPIFFGSSDPSDSSHIQLAKQSSDPTPPPDEGHLFAQLISEFSILAVEFVLQIVGIGVGAFNIIKDSISHTFFPPGDG